MKRRDFLKTSVLATAALASSPLAAEAKKEKPKIKAYRNLGKTGLKISDISLGTGRLSSPSMVLRAIDRGINYMDTAPDYGSSLEGSLSRMKTDYVDFCFVHAIGEANSVLDKEKARLLDEEMLSAVDELKKMGKLRFLAVSSHGPDNMEDLLYSAVQSGHYDLIMPSFNFLKFPRLPSMMKEAKKRGVAVVAMKTLAGAKEMDFDSKGAPFEPAAFKWVLNHSEVSGLVITIKTVSDLDLFLTASGQKFTAEDQRVLDRYARLFSKEYCRTGCNQCESACPEGVAIASTLRYQMYFKDYGMEKNALEYYARLDRNAEKCKTCVSLNCTGSCPYGLEVSALLRDAHDTLSFVV
jgi:predicted aldo/keto reductase-like oxidoreductase